MRRHRRPSPLDPLNDRQLRRQSRRDVRAQVDPIVGEINKRTLSGSENITGIARQLANDLGGYAEQERGIYAGAEQSLGGIDKELAGQLGASGASDDLRARLQAAGQDPGLADSLLAASHGAAGAGFAHGAAERQQLVTQGAGAQEYAAKLPGLARLSGLQGVNDRAAQGRQDIGEVMSKVPGLVAQSIMAGRDREYQKAVARLGFAGDTYSADLNYQAKTASTAEQHRYHDKTVAVRREAIQAENKRSGMSLRERAAHNGVTEREQANRDQETARKNRQSDHAYNEDLSRNAGHAVDKHGRAIINPKTGKPYPYKKKSSSAGGSASGLGN